MVSSESPIVRVMSWLKADARSFLSTLSTVVQSGITTLIWAGDADWICNWFGGLASAEAITYSGSSTFKSTAVSNYTVNGAAGGTFKSFGNLSWLRVFGAGHEVPYYRRCTIGDAGIELADITL